MGEVDEGINASVASVSRAIRALASLLKRGFFHILFGGVAVKITTFASSIVIVRLMTKGDYAALVYVDNIYSYLYLFAGLGFASGILKFCVGDDPEKNRSYFDFALKWGLLFQAVIAIMSLVGFGLIDLPLRYSSTLGALLVVYPCFYYAINLLQAMMRARLLNKEYAWVGLINAMLLMLASIALVLKIGVLGVVPARYFAATISVLLSIWILRKDLGGPRCGLSKAEKKAFISFSMGLLTANVFSMAMPINEVFLINNMLNDASVIADFRVAGLIPSQIVFLTSVIMTFFVPYFAKLQPNEEAWLLSKKVGVVNGLIVGATVILGVALTPFITELVYGSQYACASGLSSMMWAAYGLNAALRVVPMNILPMLGFTRINVVLSVTSCLIHFLIEVLLIGLFGVNGAVYAALVVYALSGVIFWIYLYRQTGKRKFDDN